jgi:hypothetical protein
MTEQRSKPSKGKHMNLFNAVVHLDWIRAVSFWLLIGIVTTAWEFATLFGRALAARYGRKP